MNKDLPLPLYRLPNSSVINLKTIGYIEQDWHEDGGFRVHFIDSEWKDIFIGKDDMGCNNNEDGEREDEENEENEEATKWLKVEKNALVTTWSKVLNER